VRLMRDLGSHTCAHRAQLCLRMHSRPYGRESNGHSTSGIVAEEFDKRTTQPTWPNACHLMPEQAFTSHSSNSFRIVRSSDAVFPWLALAAIVAGFRTTAASRVSDWRPLV
jgi:hypothetical protein